MTLLVAELKKFHVVTYMAIKLIIVNLLDRKSSSFGAYIG